MHISSGPVRTGKWATIVWKSVLCSLLLSPLGTDAQQKDPDSTAFKLRPTFGMEVGMFAFYGDIGSSHAGYDPLLSRVGYRFRAGTPLTPWLDVTVFGLFGRVGANERGTDRNLNFESRVTTGGFQFSYNFLQLLHPDHVVEPYISVGLESVEFVSKTDLFDAQGRRYHYWSDGTIRDLDEHDPNAGLAIQLQRDHTYESDIRELDLDGFGKYAERSWGVPIGVGARMRLGGGFDLRVGTELHLTGTDLIDGVTADSREERQGDARNDRFLFSSFSIDYAIDIHRKPARAKGPTISNEEMDQIALHDDEDGDGVSDMHDDCPHTPAGTKVDAHGCPLDGDGDGVADDIDLEPASAPGAIVDADGVTLTDEALLKAYLNYKDSANANIVTTRVESVGPPPKAVNAKPRRSYVVQVGTEVEGISEDMIDRILSIPDVRTIVKGDTTFYVVGDYDAIPEAIRRELALDEQGMPGKVMAQVGSDLVDISDQVAQAKAALGEGPTPTEPAAGAEEAVVRVQLGAFRYELSRNIFAGINDLVVLKGDDGLTRYYTGSYTDINAAAKHRVDMLLKGFNGAFLVAFKNGKRVSLKEAGARLTGHEDLDQVPQGTIDKSLVRYRVQVGTFAGNVPMDVMDKYLEVGNVTPVTSAEAVRYFYGSFTDRAAAEEARQSLQTKGLTDAFVVGELGGRIISADDADHILAGP
ncbi:MAG: SPOR domain-containing protein [Flavobacteriales bacterium]|nr:SPOR domain-containing protein [Flavobacteriales bacterium]MCB9194473.1 SPOR domain-containing protein [Flavobacteriales bacterium]